MIVCRGENTLPWSSHVQILPPFKDELWPCPSLLSWSSLPLLNAYQFLHYSLGYLSPFTLFSNYLCMCLITLSRMYCIGLLRKVKIRNSPNKVYFCTYYVSILEAIIHCVYLISTIQCICMINLSHKQYQENLCS